MLVFVDETGDTDLKLNRGGSKCFIVVLVFFDNNDDVLAEDKRIDEPRAELNLPVLRQIHESNERTLGKICGRYAPDRFCSAGDAN